MKHSYHQHRCHRNSLYTVEENTGKGNVHPQLVLKTTAGLFKHVYIHILIFLGSFQPEHYLSLFFKQALIIMVWDFMTFVTLELGTHTKNWVDTQSFCGCNKKQKQKKVCKIIIIILLHYFLTINQVMARVKCKQSSLRTRLRVLKLISADETANYHLQ